MIDLPILSEIVDGHWRPGIGDPTVVGWLTVVAYLLAAVGCGWAAFREPFHDGRATRKPATFWLVLATFMTCLGINKQLDLQTLLTQVGRQAFKDASLYQDRRVYQVAFIGLVAVACVLLLAWFLWASRRLLGNRWPAMVGMAFVLGFVVIRAASFHHVDVLLGSRVGALKWNWLLELDGIMVVGATAFRACLGRKPRPPTPARTNKNIFYYYDRLR